MLEEEAVLSTWAIPPQLLPPQSFACTGKRLPDHRIAYLDYEGPVSNNRGTVRCVDRGTYLTLSPGQFRVSGRLFHGELSIESQDGGHVRVTFVAD